MKVLFAVSNDGVTSSVVQKYQQKYKEIITKKSVYYFNAIIKELQKDRTYDALVIGEDLEPLANNDYAQADKFVFEKLDEISDEASKNSGEDIPIIFICADRRTREDALLIKLFGIGVYNALVENDRSIEKVCELIAKPRSKKEAKNYYKLEGGDVSYSPATDSEIDEAQVQNILNYFAKVGNNEQKIVQTFDHIADQYTDTQLRLIVNVLPLTVKATLESSSPRYQKLMNGGTVLSNGEYQEYTVNNPRKPTPLDAVTVIDITDTNKKKDAVQVVIPSSMNYSGNTNNVDNTADAYNNQRKNYNMNENNVNPNMNQNGGVAPNTNQNPYGNQYQVPYGQQMPYGGQQMPYGQMPQMGNPMGGQMPNGMPMGGYGPQPMPNGMPPMGGQMPPMGNPMGGQMPPNGMPGQMPGQMPGIPFGGQMPPNGMPGQMPGQMPGGQPMNQQPAQPNPNTNVDPNMNTNVNNPMQVPYNQAPNGQVPFGTPVPMPETNPTDQQPMPAQESAPMPDAIPMPTETEQAPAQESVDTNLNQDSGFTPIDNNPESAEATAPTSEEIPPVPSMDEVPQTDIEGMPTSDGSPYFSDTNMGEAFVTDPVPEEVPQDTGTAGDTTVNFDSLNATDSEGPLPGFEAIEDEKKEGEEALPGFEEVNSNDPFAAAPTPETQVDVAPAPETTEAQVEAPVTDPMAEQTDPMAGQTDPMAGQIDPMAGQTDPMNGQVDPMTMQPNPMAQQPVPPQPQMPPMGAQMPPQMGPQGMPNGMPPMGGQMPPMGNPMGGQMPQPQAPNTAFDPNYMPNNDYGQASAYNQPMPNNFGAPQPMNAPMPNNNFGQPQPMGPGFMPNPNGTVPSEGGDSTTSEGQPADDGSGVLSNQ